jgi:Predicted SAM-dependent methyltransferases
MDHMTEKVFTLPEIGDGEDKSSPLKNCIRNNYRHVRKWAKRTMTDCFRIYDREIREFPLAIDYYAGRFCVHYFAKTRESDDPPQKLVDLTVNTLTSLFNADPAAIYWRTRIKREKREQYEKAGESQEYFTVMEYGVKFKVNLLDYLDTGLFLDHRETRRLVAAESKGKRVLNLFAYTCSFSVHAALAGSTFTKSVDMSNTYTAWGRDNFKINSLSLINNEIVRADCMKFLDAEIRTGKKYDVIIIDPPTISRSKKMEGMFDIQLDYIFLLSKSLQLLSKGGVIFFSTNSRKFVFDKIAFASTTIDEISYKTLPVDFHDPKIHRCWKIKLL